MVAADLQLPNLPFRRGDRVFFYRGHPRFWDFYSTIPVDVFILPYVKGLSEQLRRCLQQQGVRAVFKSETTLRSQLVRPKDAVDPAKQDGVVYRIPCECGKVYIGETGARARSQGPRRGRGWGALALPLFCKNKNKLNKK